MYYVLWTTTGKEQACKDLIERLCDPETYESVFIPKRMASVKKNGKRSFVEQKLFPSYVFVETDAIEAFWEQASSIPGFLVLLKSDESFVPLSSIEEALLTSLMGDTGIVEPSIGLIEGENVIITEGPLKDLESNIEYIDRHKRMAILSIELLGRCNKVKVPLEIVEKK